MSSLTSNFQTAQEIFNLFESIGQSQHMLKFGGNLSSRNRDMTQNVLTGGLTLKGQFFLSDLRQLLIRTHLKFH